jgi:hypothetical protein
VTLADLRRDIDREHVGGNLPDHSNELKPKNGDPAYFSPASVGPVSLTIFGKFEQV